MHKLGRFMDPEIPITRDPARSELIQRNWLCHLLLLILSAELVFQAILAFRLNVHWDEFHFLSQIYEFERGDLSQRLQTFHVHLFTWLTGMSHLETDEIIIGRMFVWMLHIATIYFLYLWLRPEGREAALFTLVVYQAMQETLVYGTNFRSDPLIVLLVSAALALSAAGVSRARCYIVPGVLFGLALLINLKSIFFLFFFLGVRWFAHCRNSKDWLSFGAASFVTFIFGYYAHAQFLAAALPQIHQSSLIEIGRSFLLRGLSDAGLGTLAQSLVLNPVSWTLIVAGGIYSLRYEQKRAFTLFLLLLFSALLFIYRNAWPYFLPLAMLPLLPVICSFANFTSRALPRVPSLLFALLIVIGNGLVRFSGLTSDGIEPQRALLSEVHRLYPEPVPYIDRCGMVSSFPSAGPFLTSYFVEKTRSLGRPVFDGEALEHAQFLIRNSPYLESDDLELTAEDRILVQLAFPYCSGTLCFRESKELARAQAFLPRSLFRY